MDPTDVQVRQPTTSGSSRQLLDDRADLGRFLSAALQVGLLLFIVRQFRLENELFYDKIMPLAFFGFLIHYFLPQRYRLSFFLALSLVGVHAAFGFPNSLWLIGIGLLLISVCHLPLPFVARAALIVATGICLALLRMGRIDASWAAPVLPILASMFMFRIIIYLYDLKHQKGTLSIQHTLSYFFLLPNIAFPLFPIVDHGTFRRTYYDTDQHAIYQKGIRWILWGIIQLLTYRYIQHYWVIAPEDITNLRTLAQHAAANYLLIIRLIGQYTLAIGILHLFGFNLPAIVQRFLLAPSFTEYWRCANIYWKDFIQKIVFYPVYFQLRKLDPTVKLVVSMIIVFAATWFLHAYQWFWIRGSFLLSLPDVLFWAVFGVCVITNAVYESKLNRRRSLGEGVRSWRGLISHAVRAMGLFAFIAVLWSLWTSPSVLDWVYLWFDTDITAGEIIRFVPILLLAFAVFLAAVLLFEGTPQVSTVTGRASLAVAFFQRAPVTGAAIVVLLLLGSPPISSQASAKTGEVIRTLQGARLNYQETELLTRGYYEDLNASNLNNTQLWEVYMKRQEVWPTLRETKAGRLTDTFLKDEIVPSVSILFHGAPLSTNRWAMRDQEYDQEKPDNVYRIAILGGSGVFGSGVGDKETFEAVLEDRLNLENREGTYAGYEILNFSVPGYSTLQQLALLESKVVSFQPDAVFLIGTAREATGSPRHLAIMVDQGIEIPYDFLKEIVTREGIDRHTPFEHSFRRLKRHGEEMLQWAYPLFAKLCRQHGALPVYLYTPVVQDIERDPEKDAHLMGLATEAGFLVIDVSDAFEGQDTASLRVAAWDWHPNARGHRLLADRLYHALRQNEGSLGLRLAQGKD